MNSKAAIGFAADAATLTTEEKSCDTARKQTRLRYAQALPIPEAGSQELLYCAQGCRRWLFGKHSSTRFVSGGVR